MIGKKIKINDYKFTYGKEVMYVNVYGAFKVVKVVINMLYIVI